MENIAIQLKKRFEDKSFWSSIIFQIIAVLQPVAIDQSDHICHKLFLFVVIKIKPCLSWSP